MLEKHKPIHRHMFVISKGKMSGFCNTTLIVGELFSGSKSRGNVIVNNVLVNIVLVGRSLHYNFKGRRFESHPIIMRLTCFHRTRESRVYSRTSAYTLIGVYG